MHGSRFTVRGRVQGVGFRWWVLTHARELGLVGTVRNLPDGSVEVHAAGSADALERFQRLLRQGPPHASVSDVAEEGAVAVSNDSFEVVL